MTRAETQRRQVGRPDAGRANAILDIGEDPAEERGGLADTQRALLNILDDFDAEKRKVDQVNTDLRTEVVERSRAEEALESAQETLAHQALHDPLTGLPNRVLFLDRLTQALTRLERKWSTVAVFFLDLDGFKVINDSLGHDAGDERRADHPAARPSVNRFEAIGPAIRCGGCPAVRGTWCGDLRLNHNPWGDTRFIAALAGRLHPLSWVDQEYPHAGQRGAPDGLRRCSPRVVPAQE